MFRNLSRDAWQPKHSPLRWTRMMFDMARETLLWALEAMYSHRGRPSIAPERLRRRLLLRVLYSNLSARLLVEQRLCKLLLRWFVRLSRDVLVRDHSRFTKCRERLVDSDLTLALFGQNVVQTRTARLLSDEHHSVEHTLPEALGSMNSIRPIGDDGGSSDGRRNADVELLFEVRRSDTRESSSAPQARSFRPTKSPDGEMSYLAHALMNDLHGSVVEVLTTQTSGRAKREATPELMEVDPGKRRQIFGTGEGYDRKHFMEELCSCNVAAHVAQNTTHRCSEVDRQTILHGDHSVNSRFRIRIEEVLG